MKTPLRKADYTLTVKRPKHIIIHHTIEICPDVPLDNATFQTGRFQSLSYVFTKLNVKGYHFVIEKAGDEYFPIVSQPLFTQCKWDDIDESYWNDISVGILANYDFDFPEDRFYSVLAFRVLVPLCRWFNMTYSDILLHKEISSNKELTCPGEMFIKEKMIKAFRTHWRKGPTINRK
jgi:hypothetical protein